MNIYLNLLSEEKKIEIKKRMIFQTILGQGFRFCFIMLLLISILLSVKMITKINLSSIDKSNSLITSNSVYQELNKYEGDFKQMNSKITLVSEMKKNKIYWSLLIEELSRIIPQNVFLTDLATKAYNVSIIGKAGNRDELVEFQDNLKKSSCFSEVTYPLSNYTSREDLEFTIDFKVKEECVKRKN